MNKITENDIDYFNELLGSSNVLENEPMKRHTTFKIGGPASCMLLPCSTLHVSELIKYCNKKELGYFIMGNGSNLLISDRGMNKVVIKLGEKFSDVSIMGTEVLAQSGISLKDLSNTLINVSLTGFEFASGIPGTVGGAVYMNAGAYDGEMKDIVKEVEVVTKEGEIMVIPREKLGFAYRKSAIQEMEAVVTGVTFALKRGVEGEIQARIDELTAKREEKQPLDTPSAGSTFKRPDGYYAGKLIEDAGLRGYRYKDVQVSEKHCGFVVNTGSASCEDVVSVIQYISDTVFEKFGVRLEPEVRIIKDN